MADASAGKSYVTLGEALEPFKQRVIKQVFDGQKPKRSSPDNAKLDYLALAELYASQVKVPERERFKFGGTRTVLQKANTMMKELTDPTERRSRAASLQKAFPNEKVKDLNLINMPLSDRGEYVASLMKQGAITEFRKRGSVSTPRKTTTSGAGATDAAEEEKDAGSEEDDEAADVEAALKRTRARISDLESVLSRAVSPRVKSTPSLKKRLEEEQAQEAKLEERLEQLRGEDDEATERDAKREELAKTPFKESVSQEQRDAEEDFWQRQQSPLPSPRGLDVTGSVSTSAPTSPDTSRPRGDGRGDC